MASSSKDFTVKIWNSLSGVCLTTVNYHSACVTSVIWGGEGFLYSSSEDRTIKVVNDKGKLQKELKSHGHWVNCLSLNTVYSLRTGCYDEKLIQYDDRDKMKAAAQKRYDDAIKSKGELLVSGSDDCTLYLWKPKSSHKPLTRLLGHQKPINHVYFTLKM